MTDKIQNGCEVQNMNLVGVKSTELKFWTKPGLSRLGEIIRQSREFKGMTLRQAGEIVGEISGTSCNFRTINSIENATGMPQFNTLVAIASSKIATCDRGIPLDIYDFIDIASESFGMDSMNVLARLVKAELQSRNWTLGRMATECGMEFKDLFEISEGRESEDFQTDLILLGSVLANPRTGETFGSAESIMEFCGINSNDHKSA